MTDDARQWQQAQARQTRAETLATLARTHGGRQGPAGWTTDFTAPGAGGLDGLRAMIEHAEPGPLTAVADNWAKVHRALLQAQSDFQAHTASALESWTGTAADGFAARAQQLRDSLGNGAAYAQNAGRGVAAAASALTTAKRTMPAAPSEWQKLARRATSESTDQQFNEDLGTGITRDAALRLDGGQLSATEEQHQRAIVVMETLEASYNSAAKTVGKPSNDPLDRNTIWPPPPATITHDPATGSDGWPEEAVPLSLHQADGSGARLLADSLDPGQVGSRTVLDPGQVGSRTVLDVGSPGEGITDGEGLPSVSGQDTAIARASRGLGSGLGEETGSGDEAVGRSLPRIDGWLGRGRAGFEFGPADAFGGALAEGADDFAATSATVGPGVIRDGESGEQSATHTGSATGALGMGGLPGGPGSQERRRKRRPRPHYLVEDPESWESGVVVNPPVIM